MGTRINIVGKDNTPRCHCGRPLPCSKHTGSDGDTGDYYNPDIDQDNPGDDEKHHRHERN